MCARVDATPLPALLLAGPSNDLEQATNLAKSMVTKWGMTDKVGPVSIGDNAVISGQQRELIDSEVRRLCQVCYLPCWV